MRFAGYSSERFALAVGRAVIDMLIEAFGGDWRCCATKSGAKWHYAVELIEEGHEPSLRVSPSPEEFYTVTVNSSEYRDVIKGKDPVDLVKQALNRLDLVINKISEDAGSKQRLRHLEAFQDRLIKVMSLSAH